MSSSPTNVSTRGKANLSVASIINCTANIRNNTEKTGKIINVTSSLDIYTKDVITCVSPRSLPTVANSELLYKSIPAPLCLGGSQIPPLAPTRPVSSTIPLSYGLYDQRMNPFTVNYSITSNPLTHIKTLTNSVTHPVTKINIPHLQPKTSYVSIRPAPKVISKQAASIITCTSSVVNTSSNVHTSVVGSVAMSISNSLLTSSSHFPTSVFVAVKKSVNSEIQAESSSILKSVKTETLMENSTSNVKFETNQTKSNVLNGPSDINSSLSAIFVPRGWNRILEKGQITYISPNKSRFRSLEDVIQYLQLEGTCKCGLECPLKPDEVFNFNPKVPSKFGFSPRNNMDSKQESQCGVCRKFEELFLPTFKLNIDSRGRKPGKSKRSSISSDEKPSPERKKILLTGASPLEMFQTGMDAINASSTTAFKNLFKPLNNENNLELKDSLLTTVSATSSAQISNTLKPPSQNCIQKPKIHEDIQMDILPVTSLNSIKIPSQMSSIVTTSTLNTNVTSAIKVSQTVVSHGHTLSVHSSTPSLNMPFPASLMGNKKRAKQQSGRGRGRGQFVTTLDNMKSVNPLAKKRNIKKVLPNAAIKKASELQLNDYMHQNTYSLKPGDPADVIPSLRSIHTASSLASNQQILSNQTLLSSGAKTTLELRDIYKSLQVAAINQQLQQATSVYNKAASSLAVDSGHTLITSSSTTVLPPNRTASSSNQLPQALRNQLSTALGSALSSSVSKGTPNQVKQNNTTDCVTVTNKHIVTPSLQDKRSPEPSSSQLPSTSAIIIGTNDTTNQPVNRPLHNLKLSQNILNTNATTNQSVNGQQMLLLQFVTQSNTPDKVTNTKVNTPIVRAYPVSHPQAYVHSQGQSKFLVMGKGNASQALQTLALQKNQSSTSNLSQNEVNKRTLQIQGLIPMQTSQVSPRGVPAHALPVQYVTAVNRPGFPITQPTLGIEQRLDGATYSMMQYITPPTRPNRMPYVYPATNTAVYRPAVSNMTSNFVRIAPAVQPPNASAQAFEQEKKKKEQEMLESMQEQLFGKPKDTSSGVTLVSSLISSTLSSSLVSTSLSVASKVSPDTLSAASSFLANVALSTSKNDATLISISPPSLTTSISSAVVITESRPSCTNEQQHKSGIISESTTVCSSSTISLSCTTNPAICSILSSVISSPSSSLRQTHVPILKLTDVPSSQKLISTSPNANVQVEVARQQSLTDEMALHCDEKSNDLLTSSDESKQPSPLQDVISTPFNNASTYSSTNMNARLEGSKQYPSPYSVGDLVWVQIPGYPPWPGKIITSLEAKKPMLEKNKVYVSWFGSNQVHAVSFNQLKSLDEGFKGLDGNLTKRRYRANKKQLNDLEKAIAEALEESERRQLGKTEN